MLIAESTAEPTIEVLLAALEDDGRPLTIVLDDLHLVTDRRALDVAGTRRSGSRRPSGWC